MEAAVLFALLACTDPVAPKWSEATAPTVLRETDSDTDTADTASNDTAVTDTADTDTADTASNDTAVTDTADTAPDDTGDTDTGGDTGATDTGATDTGYTVATDAPGDWTLDDLNPDSPRYGEPVSPRDYISRVSGYYFIHST